MSRIKLMTVALATAICGCGRPAPPPSPSSVDENHWTVTIEDFEQSETMSTMRVMVETPVTARITFYEPDSVLHQSFLSPAGRTFEVRKVLKPGVRPQTILMETTIDGTNRSVTDLAAAPAVTMPQLHSRVLTRPRASAFGETAVIADNLQQRQTTVMVDLEPEINPDLDEAFQARRRIRNHPDDR